MRKSLESTPHKSFCGERKDRCLDNTDVHDPQNCTYKACAFHVICIYVIYVYIYAYKNNILSRGEYMKL